MTLARSSRSPFLALMAVLLAALVFTGLQAPAAAHAVGTVDITVNLKTKTGAPLSGVTVSAQQVGSFHQAVGAPAAAAATATPGRYLLTALAADEPYALYFDAPASSTTSFDQFWGGTNTIEGATYLTWDSDATFTASLDTNVTLLGKVTNASAKAIAGVKVVPIAVDGNGHRTELTAQSATTNAAGAYSITNLAPGSYQLSFRPANTSGYLAQSPGTALYLPLGTSKTVNAKLVSGATITGKVAGPQSGVTARAYPFDGTSLDTTVEYDSLPTTASGTWTIPGLPAGSYKVRLTVGTEFVDRWSVDTASPDSAEVYVVTGTQKLATGLTTLLPRTPDNGVQLTVTRQGGLPLDDSKVKVYITSAIGEVRKQLGADTSLAVTGGSFHFDYLQSGSFDVWVDPGVAGIQPYIGVQNVSSDPGDDAWNIVLQPASAFTIDAYAINSTGYQAGKKAWFASPHATIPGPVTYSYLWLRDGAPIYGETGFEHEFSGADYGHALTLIVRGDAFGYPPTFINSNITSLTRADAPDVYVPVAHTGATTWGTTVSTAPQSGVNGSAFSYEWFRDSVGGTLLGTARSYKTVAADAGHPLFVRVTAATPGYVDGSKVSSAFTPDVLPAPKSVKAPSATVTTLPGGDLKFTASPGTWSPAPAAGEAQYSWYADGEELGHGSIFVCDTNSFDDGDSAQDCGHRAPAGSGFTSVELSVFYSKLGYAAQQKRIVVRKADAGALVESSPAVPINISDFEAGDSNVTPAEPVDIGHLLTGIAPIYDFPGSGSSETHTYQWQLSADGTAFANISGATKANYTALASQLGKYLQLKVTTKSTLGVDSFTATARTGKVQLRQNIVTYGTAPTLMAFGSSDIGAQKRVEVFGSWGASLKPTQTFQWYQCDPAGGADCSATSLKNAVGSWVIIPGATATSFTPTANPGWQLAAVMTAAQKDHQSRRVVVIVGTLETAGSHDPVYLVNPTAISGFTNSPTMQQVKVGTKVTMKPGVVDDPSLPITRSWQYFQPGAPTPQSTGVSGLSYTPTAAAFEDSDGFLQYVETVTNAHGTTQFTRIFEFLPLQNAQTKAGSALNSGGTFIANPGTFKVTDPAPTYAWFVNGTAVPSGPTGPTFEPASPTAAPVWVDITVQPDGYAPITKRVVAQKGLASDVTAGASTIAGTPVVGSTLAIDTADLWTFPVSQSVTYAYQWLVGTKVVGTGATYSPTTTSLNKSVKVRVTASSPYYPAPAPFTSAPVTIVLGGTVTGTASIHGTTFKPGETLTVTKAFPPGTTFGYAWQRSLPFTSAWTTVGTTATYKLTNADAGYWMRLVLTAKRAGFVNGVVTTVTVYPDYLVVVQATAPATLTSAAGGAPIGSPLTAAATWNGTGLTLTYEWYRNGVLVPGVAGPTYTPPAGSLGDVISAAIGASRPGYLDGYVITNAVIVGQGVVPVAATKPVISGMTGAGSPKPPVRGDVLMASTPAWSVQGLEFTYIWSVGPDVIQSSDDPTFAVDQPAYVGLPITVRITAQRAGWAIGQTTSLATKNVVDLP